MVLKAVRVSQIAVLLITVTLLFWYWIASPPEVFSRQVSAPFLIPTETQISKISSRSDPGQSASVIVKGIPALDELVIQSGLGRAFGAAMDGWIWRIDLRTNMAEPYVQAPLLPAGMVIDPSNSDRIYFCASRASADQNDAPPGVYALDISSKQIQAIGLRVPKMPRSASGDSLVDPESAANRTKGNIGRIYIPGQGPRIPLNSEAGRPVEKCDDLAISADGQRIYFTEPYDHPGAILGVSWQSFAEALTLGENGRVWLYDLADESAQLIAEGYSYLDGILLENGADGRETALIVGELSKFRLLRLALRGPDSMQDSIFVEGLPGLPDGLDRDEQGRIWIALVKMRSGLLNTVHAYPFLKHLLLRVPYDMLPISKQTGLVVVSPEGRPLHVAVHGGELFSNIIVVVPGPDQVYLALYHPDQKDLLSIPYPPGLQDSADTSRESYP